MKSWRTSPKYILARLKQKHYFKSNPELPWMAKEANDFLIKNLTKDMTLLEFGSGRSTKFFANHVGNVISREHHKEWYDKVKSDLSSIDNIDYNLFKNLDSYADTSDIEDNSLDVVIIDGRNRGACFNNSISKLKQGGIIILDNSERYLKYSTSAPAKFLISTRDKVWENLEVEIKNNFWKIQTTDNVSDTYIFIKR
jgi:tRNA A58 N-methylase Trm61